MIVVKSLEISSSVSSERPVIYTHFEEFKITDTYMSCNIIQNKDGARDD